MTENPTTAEDLESGTPKPGTDYGDVDAEGTDGTATPGEPEAARAQEGVQEAFE